MKATKTVVVRESLFHSITVIANNDNDAEAAAVEYVRRGLNGLNVHPELEAVSVDKYDGVHEPVNAKRVMAEVRVEMRHVATVTVAGYSSYSREEWADVAMRQNIEAVDTEFVEFIYDDDWEINVVLEDPNG